MLDMQQTEYLEALTNIPDQDSKKCIDDFYTVFMQQKHIIKEHPELTFQQMYNELHWKKGRTKTRIEESRKIFLSEGRSFLHQYRQPQIVETQLIMTLIGHTGGINSCAFSFDGKQIVSGSSDNTLKIWNAETGKEIRSFTTGHTNLINSSFFSPDGKWIVSGSYDKTLKIWDAETGKEIRTLTGHSDFIESCAFSLMVNELFLGVMIKPSKYGMQKQEKKLGH